MSFLSLRGAGYRYPGTEAWIFRDFDMNLGPGEAIRVTGRNGSGKSTLLKVISGLLQLTEGELLLGKGVAVSYMDQYAGEMLAHDLTIGEHFRAVVSKSKNGLSPVDLLDQFGLGLHVRLREFIGHLSGGQRQIVALLCVLASGATVLCLDEFTSALDERSARVAEGLLEHMTIAKNITIVLVSHSGARITVNREFDISV